MGKAAEALKFIEDGPEALESESSVRHRGQTNSSPSCREVLGVEAAEETQQEGT